MSCSLCVTKQFCDKFYDIDSIAELVCPCNLPILNKIQHHHCGAGIYTNPFKQ